MDRAADLATVAHLPLEEGLNGRTSQFIDAMLIPRADRLHIGVPMNHHLRRENPIEGGYVHTIKPGIYRWVVVLDFKSMYPSIIIQKNLCFTTLSDQGTTVSPSGAKFLSPDVRPGVIPAILKELLADRDRLRRQMAAATTDAERQYYDGLQNAVKVLMNSFYGVLASSFYRFTDKAIGAAITSFAREAITSIIRTLEADGNQVVYSDTDSVFVLSPVGSIEGPAPSASRSPNGSPRPGSSSSSNPSTNRSSATEPRSATSGAPSGRRRSSSSEGTRRDAPTRSTTSRSRCSRSSTLSFVGTPRPPSSGPESSSDD